MNRNIRVMRNRKIPVVLYDTALNSAAYGNTGIGFVFKYKTIDEAVGTFLGK
jgi:hypothetical protein